MRNLVIVLLVLFSTLIQGQNRSETYEPKERAETNLNLVNADQSVKITNVSDDLNTCTLYVKGITYKRALDIMVDMSIKSKRDSSLGGFTCTYNTMTKVYTLINDATGATVTQSTSVGDIRKYMKSGEMPYAMLGVL
jgi:hypothetical protein